MSEDVNNREDLLDALQKAAHGLTYISESDFPLEPFYWTKEEIGAAEITTDRLLAVTKQPAGTPVETLDFVAFFDPATTEEDWFGEEEKATAAGFRRLVETLKSHLTDLKVFKVGGEPQKAVYVVGKTPGGDFAGVRTQVVET